MAAAPWRRPVPAMLNRANERFTAGIVTMLRDTVSWNGRLKSGVAAL
jgi:hypothetical protein